MIKPIFTIGIPNATQKDLINIQRNTTKQLEGYHVLVYSYYSDDEEIKFECFYEKDFNEVKFEELKEIIKERIK